MAETTPRGQGSRYGHRMGWRMSAPDFRDHQLVLSQSGVLPPEYDLWDLGRCPKIWDQGDIGACVAFGTLRAAAIAEMHEKQPNTKVYDPSQLFTYYNGRVIEHTVDEDSGLEVRDGLKAIAKCGVAPSADWPYDTTRFMVRPPEQAYTDGATERATIYARVQQTLNAIKLVLAWNYGVVCGFVLYQSFESLTVENTGIVPLPSPSERVVGRHCMCLTAWSDKRHAFGLDNSWSPSWGAAGRCWLPYEYVLNASLAADFWTIRRVD